MFDIKQQLNASQLEAVTAAEGPVLVIAGAGSGKTRVIEYRVLNLVQNGIVPNSVLLLTFTRRAANQMLERVGRHNSNCRNIEGGTFHSFALKQLRRYSKIIGLPGSFSILDESDAEEAIHRCCAGLELMQKEKKFPKKDTLRRIVGISTNKNLSVKEAVEREYPHFLECIPGIESIKKRYAEYKLDKHYLDYDDLLVYLRLLLKREEIRDRIAERYRYIMVDEYQDTNKLQGDIAFLLAQKHKNIMVVGDDAQTIYGFRGSSHENIMDFPKKFEGCRIIKLEENYRSTQAILDLSNAVLGDMKNKYAKSLVSARSIVGAKPDILFFRNAYQEAEYIAGKIKERMDEGVTLHNQAVLFRSAYISIPLQAELSRRSIPYQVFGGLKFYETAHVKDLMAHLKVIANPKDELAWHRILMLIEGIGPKTAGQISDQIMSAVGCSGITERILARYGKGYKYSAGLARLASSLKAACNSGLSVGEQFEYIQDYYQLILKVKFDDWHLRSNDLEALRQIAARYDSLEELLSDFVIESPGREVRRAEPSSADGERPLTLSTIHSAKGLEWHTVFLIGLIEGVMPISFALKDEDAIEEERRLFYVGITRAKSKLFLSLHHQGTRGMSQFNKISRFIDTPDVMSKLEEQGGFREGLDDDEDLMIEELISSEIPF